MINHSITVVAVSKGNGYSIEIGGTTVGDYATPSAGMAHHAGALVSLQRIRALVDDHAQALAKMEPEATTTVKLQEMAEKLLREVRRQ